MTMNSNHRLLFHFIDLFPIIEPVVGAFKVVVQALQKDSYVGSFVRIDGHVCDKRRALGSIEITCHKKSPSWAKFDERYMF